MSGWALDLGTTNSAIARWDDQRGQPALVELGAICRRPEGDDALEAPRLVPSAVDMVDDPGLLDRIGHWPWVARRMFLGRHAVIGRPALERNQGVARPSFVPSRLSSFEAGQRPRYGFLTLLPDARRCTDASTRRSATGPSFRAD